MTDTDFKWPAVKDIVTEARRLAAAEPDRVYKKPSTIANGDLKSCLYVHRDNEGTATPGCLFGHALVNLGVPIEVVAALDERSTAAIIDVLTSHGAEFDDAGVGWCDSAQSTQDSGLAWGKAVAIADDRCPGV